MAEVIKRFQKGDRACMLVTSIIENIKGFNTTEGYRYRHDITFINEKKELITAEYLTPEQTQNQFSKGKKACIEAREHNVIIPIGTPEEWEAIGDNVLLARKIDGESYVYALQAATTLQVAIYGPHDAAIDIEGMLKNADLINDWLLSKQKASLNIVK